jgi:hypothetical protein
VSEAAGDVPPLPEPPPEPLAAAAIPHVSDEDAAALALPLPPRPKSAPDKPPGMNELTTVVRLLLMLGYFSLAFTALVSLGPARLIVYVVIATILTSYKGGIAAWVRRLDLRRSRRDHPSEPWLCDHTWDPKGVSVTAFSRFLRRFESQTLTRIWVIAVVLTVSWTTTAAVPWPVLAGVGAIVCWGAWVGWKIHGAGTTHVSFAKFPFHPGETVTLFVGTSDGGATYRHAEFHLHHVEGFSHAAPATAGTLRKHFHTVLSRPPGLMPGPQQDVEISFDLPPDVPGTSLSSPPASYWVLDVVANTSAGPYAESFLIPIYARPAGAA